MNEYEYRATLKRIVDGDTQYYTIDLGFRVALDVDVRLARINCPELSTQAGQNARDWVTQWFTGHTKDGQVTVQTQLVSRGIHEGDDEQGRYGRYIADVTAPDGANLNDDLVAAGHAQVYP